MKLFEILLEYGSANPFVGLVDAIDLMIREINVAIEGKSDKIFIPSLTNQLNNLFKFVESGNNWIIPDTKLKRNFHETLPVVKVKIISAINNIKSGNINNAKKCLMSAREITVKRSHLKFDTIE